MQKKLIIANWKMNGSKAFCKSFMTTLASSIKQSDCLDSDLISQGSVVICPPFAYLSDIAQYIAHEEAPSFTLGAQNCASHENGAYTGEVSCQMLRDIGCQYVIIGHSERRQYQNENYHIITEKIRRAYDSNLITVLCIGETKEAYASNQTAEQLVEQLSILSALEPEFWQKLVIAYEPVWSIGTGNMPSLSKIEQAIRIISNYTEKIYGPHAAAISILYGGSVNLSNIKAVKHMNLLNGILIGSACLDPTVLSQLVVTYFGHAILNNE